MKKKNPSDLTLRNLHALKKRIVVLEQAMTKVQRTLVKWSLKNLVPASETKLT